MKTNRCFYIFFSCMILILIILTELGCYREWSNDEILYSQRIGNRIVKSLNNFYKDNGQFPRMLTELVPTYLSKIEKPKVGVWKYSIEENGNFFYLAFESKSELEPICWYSPGSPPDRSGLLAEWRIDTR